jgi:hypothetical protein
MKVYSQSHSNDFSEIHKAHTANWCISLIAFLSGVTMQA